MNDLQKQYANRYVIMQNELHNLRAQRRKASTEAERKRCEAIYQRKGTQSWQSNLSTAGWCAATGAA